MVLLFLSEQGRNRDFTAFRLYTKDENSCHKLLEDSAIVNWDWTLTFTGKLKDGGLKPSF